MTNPDESAQNYNPVSGDVPLFLSATSFHSFISGVYKPILVHRAAEREFARLEAIEREREKLN